MKLATKLIFEFAPLVLFFLASAVWEDDFMKPTTVLVASTVVSLVLTWRVFRQPALMAIINAVTGIVAGSITLILEEPMYVQLKPTIIGGTYGIIIMLGLLLSKPLFKALLGKQIHLNEQGWRVLSWMWVFYFVLITAMNEYVRHYYSFHEWATFKIAVLVPLTVIYALPQIWILKKYRLPGAEPMKFTDWKRDTAEATSGVRQPAS